MRRGATVGNQGFDGGHHRIGVAGPSHPHGQGLAGVLVHDVQQLEPPLIGCLVEREVEGPHGVGPLGPLPFSGAGVGAAALAAVLGAAQALFPPQALDALAVDGPALSPEKPVRRLPAPAGMAPGDVSETPAKLVLLGRSGPARLALHGAVLAHHSTSPAFGDP